VIVHAWRRRQAWFVEETHGFDAWAPGEKILSHDRQGFERDMKNHGQRMWQPDRVHSDPGE
jgi:hypothetical protein